MHKIIVIGAITLLMAGCGASASIDMDTTVSRNTKQTTSALKLMVDGQAVLPALSPFYSGDILYVPAKVLMEYYTSDLKWNNTAKTLTLTDGSSKYVLQPDQEYMQGDGYQYTLGGPTILRKGHLYIPANSLNTLSGAEAKLNASNTAVMVTSGSVSTTVRTPSEPLATAEGNDKIKLYTTLKDGDMYKGFILEVKGQQHNFDWQAPRLLNYPPKLYYADIDKDGLEEAIIVFVRGTGTGIVEQELHVVKPQEWEQVIVTPADKAASAVVSTTLSKDKEDLLVKLQIKGPTPSIVSLRLPGRAEDWDFDMQGGIGAVTHYMVDSGRLKADTDIFIGLFESIGSFTIVYKSGTDGMEPESIRFDPYPEYAEYVEGSQL